MEMLGLSAAELEDEAEAEIATFGEEEKARNRVSQPCTIFKGFGLSEPSSEKSFTLECANQRRWEVSVQDKQCASLEPVKVMNSDG